MTFNGIVDRFAEVSGYSHTASKKICDDILKIILESIINKEEVSIYGFGKLLVRERHVQAIKSPTGIFKDSHKKLKVVFKPSNSLEKRLNDKYITKR